MIGFRFRRAYDAELASGTNRNVFPIFHFDAVEGERAPKPLLVDVHPWGADSWHGVFEGDSESPDVITGLFAHPDENKLLVVSGGQGYVVRSNDPNDWEPIPHVPITNIVDAPEHGLVVIGDYLQVAAFDATDRRWETPRLAYDGIEFEDVRNGKLTGLAWSAPLNRGVPFAIDLASGQHEGGAWRSTDDRST